MTYQRLTDELLEEHEELFEEIKEMRPGESLFYQGSTEKMTKLRRLFYSYLNGVGIKHLYVLKLKHNDLEVHRKETFKDVVASRISPTQAEDEIVDRFVKASIDEKHPLTFIRDQAKLGNLTFEQAIKAQKEIARVLGIDAEKDTNPLFPSEA